MKIKTKEQYDKVMSRSKKRRFETCGLPLGKKYKTKSGNKKENK